MGLETVDTPSPLGLFFKDHNIYVTTYAHPAVFRVGEGEDIKQHIAGAHTKNLFLKDKKGALLLVTAKDDTVIDLKWLSKHIGSARFSFGKPDLLLKVLSVTPGSVTPFAILNDTDHRVTVIYDAAMMAHDVLNFHPLINTMTTSIKRDDLLKFCTALNITPKIVDFTKAPINAETQS